MAFLQKQYGVIWAETQQVIIISDDFQDRRRNKCSVSGILKGLQR